MCQRRRDEDSAKALLGYVGDATKLQIAAQSEVSIPRRRRHARAVKLASEERLATLEAERLRAARARALEARQSEALAAEVESREAARERTEREIQRICAESEELKELERQLKVAYMNKDRAAQHEERLVAERRAQLREAAIERAMAVDREKGEREEALRASSQQAVLLQQKAALQDQIGQRERLKVEAAAEAAKDKAIVEAVAARIQAEDEAEHAEKLRRKAECRDLIKSYEVQRARERDEAVEKQRRDDGEIRRHAEELMRREAELERQREEKKARDAENFRRIVAETQKQRLEEEELQRLRDMLWEEEMEAARAKEEHDRAEQRAMMKRDMAKANERQLAAKEERKKREADAELERAAELREQFALDEARERQKADERHQAKLHFMDSVQKQKEDRLRLYELSKKIELDDADRDAKAEDYRKRVVAEARRRLLLEHAKDLQGYLPKGVLQPEDHEDP